MAQSQTGDRKERKRKQNEARHGGNLKDPQVNLLRAISRVNHCGLFTSQLTDI